MSILAPATYSGQTLQLLRLALSKSNQLAVFNQLEQKFGPVGNATYQIDDRVDIGLVSDFLAESAGQSNNDNIAVETGQCLAFSQFGALSYYLMSCSTLFEIFRAWVRCYELVMSNAESVKIELLKNGISLIVESPYQDTKGEYLRLEFLLSLLISNFQMIGGADLKPEFIELPLNNDHSQTRLSTVFGCEVTHNDRLIIIHFSKEWIGKQLPNANPSLKEALKTELDTALKQFNSGLTFIDQIYHFLDTLDSLENVGLGTVATQFNVSDSTAKRRIADLGSNFKSIFTGYRQTRSLYLLTDKNRHLDVIARQLGFSERASFERAFKKWYSLTPAQFRDMGQILNITAPIEHLLRTEKLPASPKVCQDIIRITQSPDYDISELVRAIEVDPVLSGKIVGLSNSAFYGSVSNVNNLNQAIVKIGVDMITNIALAIMSNEQMAAAKQLPINLKRYWLSALTIAQWVSELAKDFPKHYEPSNWIYLSGLLHNIGYLLLASLRPEACAQLEPLLELESSLEEKIELESRVFGINRFSATAILLAHWSLPKEVISITRGFAKQITTDVKYQNESVLIFSVIKFFADNNEQDGEKLEILSAQLTEILDIDQNQVKQRIDTLTSKQHELEVMVSQLLPA